MNEKKILTSARPTKICGTLNSVKHVERRVRTALVAASTALLFSLSACTSHINRDLLGQPSPSARVVLLDGNAEPLSAYRGQPVVVVFWATWCSHTKQILQRLDQYAAKLSSARNPKNGVFLAVNLDRYEDASKVASYIKENHLDHLTHAFSGNASDDEAFTAFRGDTIPLVLVLDSRGKIVAVDDSDDQVYSLVPEGAAR